ncbi:MAG: DUF2752 domain-containing protein [Armatimonadetes bacterium]|nr:DUF2752 domain-containing protein [Armatimonadota bacterium]
MCHARGDPGSRITMWVVVAAVCLPFVCRAVEAGWAPSVPCLWRSTFGMACPGCGLTRSVCALMRGSVLDALRWHPLGPFCVAVLWVVSAAAVAERVAPAVRSRISDLIDAVLRPATALGLAGVFVAVWISRIMLGASGVRWFRW